MRKSDFEKIGGGVRTPSPILRAYLAVLSEGVKSAKDYSASAMPSKISRLLLSIPCIWDIATP